MAWHHAPASLWERTTDTVARPASVRAPRRPSSPGPRALAAEPIAAEILRLQQLAGNAAVSELLARPPTKPAAPAPVDSPQRLADLAAVRRHDTEPAPAGVPRLSAAPDGRTFIYGKSYGAAGWTGVPNAAAYTNPDFQTDWQREQPDAGPPRHFAVVRGTSSPDITLESWFLGPGDHRWDQATVRIGGVTYHYYTHVSQQISGLVRDGEQEHINDAQRAYDIGYGLIARQINALAGRRFGPAATPAGADQMALDALDATLPPALSTRQPGFRGAWVRVMDALLAQTTSRDQRNWHTMTETGQRRDTSKHRVVVDLAPSSTTNINSVPSDQVVNYPATASGGPAGTSGAPAAPPTSNPVSIEPT